MTENEEICKQLEVGTYIQLINKMLVKTSENQYQVDTIHELALKCKFLSPNTISSHQLMSSHNWIIRGSQPQRIVLRHLQALLQIQKPIQAVFSEADHDID